MEKARPALDAKQSRLRRRLYEILEVGPKGDLIGRLADGFLVTLILANLLAMALETLPDWRAYERYFTTFEAVSIGIFTIEYLARLWVSVERSPAQFDNSLKARLRYALSPLAIVDLLAVLPFYLGIAAGLDLRALRVFRVVRLLKLTRYSLALATLFRVIRNEAKALTAALIIMIGMVFLAASLLYTVERHAQPDAFQSIPHAMWWAISTLTTVGYGDVVPVTALGRLLASIIMICGLGVYAIPIGIIVSGFSEEIHRFGIMKRLELLAKVPLFKGLGAAALHALSRYVRLEKYVTGSLICVAGDRAMGLMIVAAGQVDAHIGERMVTLHPGDYFGELALIKSTRHQVTAVAGANCQIMTLDAADFLHLSKQEDEIAAVLVDALHQRLDALSETGELSREEAQRALERWRLISRQHD